MMKEKAPAFICNNSSCKYISELIGFWKDCHAGDWLDVLRKENMLAGNPFIGGWTVPKWAQIGDIVFMMETVTSIDSINRLIKELKEYASSYSLSDFKDAMYALSAAKETYDMFGGKIFAVAKVLSEPEFRPCKDDRHWLSDTYADYGEAFFLQNPVRYDVFKDFQKVSNYGAITALSSENYNRLKLLVMAENDTPDWFRKGYIA